MLAAWREYRLRRRTQSEARQLAHEARLILKKRRAQIPEGVANEIAAAATAVEETLDGDNLERTRQAVSRLDEKMDEHLAFGRKSSLREYGESIGVAVAIALLLRAFVVEAFQIPSGSMIPTLEIGDHIFVSKFSYGLGIPFTYKKILQFSEPKRGEIIVFRFPQDPQIDYIKRVIGLPGDRVEVRSNEIFINGRPMPRNHVGPFASDDGSQSDGGRMRQSELWLENLDGKVHKALHDPSPGSNPNFTGIVVPPGNVFVMGDNRDNSNDSRFWGTVPEHLIKGRALIVWWSRGPTQEGFSLSGIKEWFAAIRWRRFFTLVE